MAKKIETLVWGYGLVEGPRVDADDLLYWSDVPNGGVYCRTPDGRIENVVPKRRGVGGIALHADGGLVISGRNICHVRGGQTRVLFTQDDVAGWNDLFTDASGRILAGSLRSSPFGPEPGAQAGDLWRIEAEGRATRLYGGVRLTNGIGLAPDGRHVYHSDTVPREILVHELTPDGAAKQRRVLATLERGAPDGLAVDEAGCVWVAAYGGGAVLRYTPDGVLDLALEVPARSVTSLCFGGADRRDLYVTSADNSEDSARGGSIFRTRADVPGLPVAPARI